MLQAEQCLSAVINVVAGEHSSFHQWHRRGILATTAGLDIDWAIWHRGRQGREKSKVTMTKDGQQLVGRDNTDSDVYDVMTRTMTTINADRRSDV